MCYTIKIPIIFQKAPKLNPFKKSMDSCHRHPASFDQHGEPLCYSSQKENMALQDLKFSLKFIMLKGKENFMVEKKKTTTKQDLLKVYYGGRKDIIALSQGREEGCLQWAFYDYQNLTQVSLQPLVDCITNPMTITLLLVTEIFSSGAEWCCFFRIHSFSQEVSVKVFSIKK